MLIQPSEIQQVASDVMNMLHEEELEIVNNFYEAVVAKDIEKIDELFPILVHDVEDHFNTEEEMMQKSNYSQLQMHKSDHDTMRKKIAKFHKRWEVLKSAQEVQDFLERDFRKWLMLHVSKWDAETALQIDAMV